MSGRASAARADRIAALYHGVYASRDVCEARGWVAPHPAQE
jgi:hypothetical protein